MSQQIQFFSEGINHQLTNEKIVAEWIAKCIQHYQKTPGELNFIFCTDDYLLKLNQQYLDHDTYTDVITFNYVTGDQISGDIFISIDRVRENAKKLTADFDNELNRVMIHGILHLIGYADKAPEEAQEIRAQEDFCLSLHFEK